MRKLVLSFLIVYACFLKAQVVNYVNNGSFEELFSPGSLPNSNKTKLWSGIDTTKYPFYVRNESLNNVPGFSFDYQMPRSGMGFVMGTFLCSSGCNTVTNRSYFRNELKQTLISGKSYCVKFYVNVKNSSPNGIDGIGAFFGDNTLDTIKYPDIKITYLVPQIKNLTGNVVVDTLNWVEISGTFTATGIEKYMVIGNFLSDLNTGTVQLQSSTQVGCDLNLDDVSCIELDLPAYAGRDTSVFVGDSVFLGREPDVGIKEACVWYKMTSATTSVTLDTIAGFWVKPLVTSTYIVQQEICGMVKLDTVTIYMDAVGIEKLKILQKELKVYPVPAQDYFELRIGNGKLVEDYNSICICNMFGETLFEKLISFDENILRISTSQLSPGTYFITIRNSKNENITKKLLISK
ncbi:T9SS type A sorting domain-containing protein [Aurantibacillus circumpalustris]|uniref:T9SS type A sorting domain-containing protein n=1 Tax=Aurantibacillus circumpalustris TaxID=3036359 RepID=UPI00295B9264|nr:T9SS type A sorting domain-containing protein [Aurantibacillus circumpalustris]